MSSDPRTMMFAYPRTGTTWTNARVGYMYYRYVDYMGGRIGKGFWKLRYLWGALHGGYHPFEGPDGGETVIPSGAERVFCLLRDARQVVLSYWFYLKMQPFNADLGPIPELEEYVREIGVRRYLRYLATVNELLRSGRAQGVLFYDDVGSDEFLAETAPMLLGLDWVPPSWLVAEAQRKTFGVRVNTCGTDPSAASPELMSWIQREVTEQCVLEEYRDRYLLQRYGEYSADDLTAQEE